MYLQQLFDNFQFNDHLSADEEVNLVAAFDFNAVVYHRNPNLIPRLVRA